MPDSKSNLAGKIDLGVSVVLGALSVYLYLSSISAAEYAVRTYGHNIDSGVGEFIVAVYYLAPIAVFFAVAGIGLLKYWRLRWYIHWAAVAAIILPIVLPALTHFL